MFFTQCIANLIANIKLFTQQFQVTNKNGNLYFNFCIILDLFKNKTVNAENNYHFNRGSGYCPNVIVSFLGFFNGTESQEFD